MRKNSLSFAERLTNFIKGSNTTQDKAAFDQLFDHYEKQKDNANVPTPIEMEQHGNELFQKISRTLMIGNQPAKTISRSKLINMGRIWWAAASLIFILLFSGTSDFWMPQAEQVVMGWMQVERTVAPGMMQQYQLPDGTKVCLNAGSKLTYPRFFLGHSREVKLSGEAFFEVTHNAQKPFIIHSGAISTHVLGTSFNIKAYEGIDRTTVTVATGRVQVSQNDRLLSTLTANQEITVDNLSGKFTLLDRVKTDKRLAWQTGRLVFDNAHIEDVIAELSNRYNVKFDDGLANLQGKYVTADFDSETTLSQVLNVVAGIDKLNFSLNDSVIVITNQKH